MTNKNIYIRSYKGRKFDIRNLPLTLRYNAQTGRIVKRDKLMVKRYNERADRIGLKKTKKILTEVYLEDEKKYAPMRKQFRQIKKTNRKYINTKKTLIYLDLLKGDV